MFAKLYETELGQILVKRDTHDDGRPEIRFYFEPEGFGVCSHALTYPDTDEGFNDRDKFFDSLTVEKAVSFVSVTIHKLKGLNQ